MAGAGTWPIFPLFLLLLICSGVGISLPDDPSLGLGTVWRSPQGWETTGAVPHTAPSTGSFPQHPRAGDALDQPGCTWISIPCFHPSSLSISRGLQLLWAPPGCGATLSSSSCVQPGRENPAGSGLGAARPQPGLGRASRLTPKEQFNYGRCGSHPLGVLPAGSGPGTCPRHQRELGEEEEGGGRKAGHCWAPALARSPPHLP